MKRQSDRYIYCDDEEESTSDTSTGVRKVTGVYIYIDCEGEESSSDTSSESDRYVYISYCGKEEEYTSEEYEEQIQAMYVLSPGNVTGIVETGRVHGMDGMGTKSYFTKTLRLSLGLGLALGLALGLGYRLGFGIRD